MIRFLLACLALTGCMAHAAPMEAPTLDLSRTAVIDTVIMGGNIFQMIPKMEEIAAKDRSKPLDLVLSSPGGDVMTGFLFINGLEHIKSLGTKVRCFVPTMAASMAFQILVHCNERYALSKAFLLWHGVRVSGIEALTAPAAAKIAEDLEELNNLVLFETSAAMSPDLEPAVVRHHFVWETLHTASVLALIAPHFITTYDAIPGLFEAMMSPIPIRPAPLNPFGKFSQGQIVYVWRGLK